MDIVYLNGNMVDKHQAQISVFDYGFLYGYGLFETMRSYNGVIFRVDTHLARLKESADALGIRIDIGALKMSAGELLAVNHLTEARVRLMVSIGEGAAVPDLASCVLPTVAIIASQYTPLTAEVYQQGYSVIISTLRRNSFSPISSRKTANYMDSLLARREAKAGGADDAILLNDKGLVAEASSSNIFILSGGRLKTPSLGSGILPGITREIVLGLAGKVGLLAAEVGISLKDLESADEIFLTNSIMELMSVSSLEGRPVGQGKVGERTLLLAEAYRAEVRRETGG